MSAARTVLLAVRLAAATTVATATARAAGRRRPVGPAEPPAGAPVISVVIPARDEARRIGPLLDAVVDAPGVLEVVVVDDESRDATAAVARAAGAAVVAGRRLPDRWVGKAWALQQGLGAARGEWVVFLDADTRPSPALPAALVARAGADGLDLLTVAGRFDCPTAGLRWLHPALLTTLVQRSPPPGATHPGPVHRRVGNGQCMVLRRAPFVAAGGFEPVAHHTVEDVALVRAMACAGFVVDFLDAGDLLTVRMYESAPEAWRAWGRSLSLPGVDGPVRRIAAVVVAALAQGAPLLRVAARRGDVLDAVLLALRVGTLAGTARSYTRRGPAYWMSPAADALAVAALAASVARRDHRWRGRRYRT